MAYSRELSKYVAMTAILGALGNVLALISMILGNVHPQIAIDLSHLATVFAAYMVGPLWATLVGALISIVPFIRFGLMGGLGPIAGSLIFPGKALTGLFAGLLAKRVKHPMVALGIGYIPESIFTWLSFRIWIPILAPQSTGWLTDAIIYGILIKAWIEILSIGVASELILPNVRNVISNGFIDQFSN